MKLIIAGGATLFPSYGFIMDSIKMLGITNIKEVVSGCCVGVDQEGEHWASHAGVPVKHFPANFKEHGDRAVTLSNIGMAEYGDCLLLIWDGESAGSYSMRTEMQKLNKPIYEVILTKES